MSAELLQRLVTIYRGENIRHPQLRAVSLAQWMLESGRASSRLARDHYNFGGLKWRKEMVPYATRVKYGAHDGEDFYCKFATLENFIAGYWAFLNRSPYSGWENHVATPEEFIRFIGPIYTPSAGYADRVLALLPEAVRALDATVAAPAPAPAPGARKLGAIVLDPGHGGEHKVPGSSPNNAISFSNVKEKKLTLEFAFILRDELLRQAAAAGEQVKVVLTRETDVNPTGSARAGLAFEHRAKLFVCIHFNGAANRATRGVETFYRAASNGNVNLAADMEFSGAVHRALFSALKAMDPAAKDRGVKPDTQTGHGVLGVLNDHALGNDRRPDPCRCAYVEVEFITNPAVDKLLVSGPSAVANRTAAMAAVARACLGQMRQTA